MGAQQSFEQFQADTMRTEASSGTAEESQPLKSRLEELSKLENLLKTAREAQPLQPIPDVKQSESDSDSEPDAEQETS